MKFKALSAPSLKELFVTELENMILSGELEIGSQLPSERDLSSSMKVSRAVINSGITEMANKGFLVIQPRQGTFVADYRKTGTVETLISIMKYNGGTLRRQEIRSILELRLIMDKFAVEKLIPILSDTDLFELKKWVDGLSNAKDNKTAAECAFSFMHEMYVQCGNTLFPLICYSFREPVLSLWERFCRLHGKEILTNDILGLYLCLEKRDIEGAILQRERVLKDAMTGSNQIYTEPLVKRNTNA